MDPKAASASRDSRVGSRPAPSVLLSLAVVIALAAILIIGTLVLNMPIELSMLFALVFMAILLRTRGFTFRRVQDAANEAIQNIIELVFILFSVGMLISSWAQSGTIPFIIRYGLELLHPSWFFLAAVLLCSITSLVTGTSWGTMGSVGVALMVVGQGLGLPAPIIAGAVISGAYFGDKLSILSDSTNLAAAITRTPILTHISYMFITTGPAYLLTLVTFGVLGLTLPREELPAGTIEETIAGLERGFSLGWYTQIPLVVLIGLLLLRVPPYIAIFGGALAGAAISLLWQEASVTGVVDTLYSGFESTTGQAGIDDLVSGGGLLSMAGLAMLFIFAVGVSGLLDQGGFVQSLLNVFMQWANSKRKLMVLTSPLMLIALALGASLAFAAVMAGTLLGPAYRKQGLRSENLSRTIEDSGTVYDAFYPWSGGGVFAAGALGVATVSYMPFMFFAFFSTIVSIVVALTQYKVRTLGPEEDHDNAEVTPAQQEEMELRS